MATWSGKVGASSDDARENSGTVGLTAGTINTSGLNQRLGFRFTNVTVPQGATVTATGFGLYLTTTTADSPANATIHGHDTDNAATFTTSTNNISNRTLTTASHTYSSSLTDVGVGYWGVDITSVIQEIIDRPGWASGNSIVIIVRGATGTNMTVQTWDGDPDNAAYLDINYNIAVTEGAVTEGVETGETLARNKRVTAILSESAAVTDPTGRLAQFPGSTSVTVALADALARRVDLRAVSIDAAALAEALSRGLYHSETLTDGATVSDGAAFLYRITRTVSEGVDMGETAAARADLRVTRVDGADMAESLTASLSGDIIEVIAAASAWENPAGTVTLSGTSANVYVDQPYSAILFRDVDIPAGSTIVSAYLRLYVYTYDDPALTIYAESSIAPAALTSGFENTDISERTPTTASVAWDAVNVGTGAGIDSADIGAVIQEVHDITGWVGGVSDILLILEDDGSGGFIRFYSGYHPDTSLRPQLIVTYSTGAVTVAGEVGDGLTAADVAVYDFLASLALAEGIATSETVARILATAKTRADGMTIADVNILGRLILTTASAGVNLADVLDGYYAVYGDATDGAVMGDSLAARIDALGSVATGAILGAALAKAATLGAYSAEYIMPFDVLARYVTYRPGVSSTVAAGSGIVGTATVAAGIIEGVDMGAALLGIATVHAALSDGLISSDTLASDLLAYLQGAVSEGVRGGDSRTAAALRVAALADGVRPVDGFVAVLTALRGLSDAATMTAAASRVVTSPDTVTDGAGLADSGAARMSAAKWASDGAAVGDATTRGLLAALAVAESAIAGDGRSGGAVFYVQTADGLSMAETVSRVLQTAAAISDGFQTGSVAVRFTARGEVTVTFETRVGTVTAVIG
jgi:hypothetical protein